MLISIIYIAPLRNIYIAPPLHNPPGMKMLIGSINSVNGNRILSSFYHFAYCKLHNNDKKCLVYRGRGKEPYKGLLPHSIQACDNYCRPYEVMDERLDLIKDIYVV